MKLSECKLCEMSDWTEGIKPVPGCGSETAAVMLVGEAPGSMENLQGKPFVGPAGNVLSEHLKAVGWDREDVYISNVVKCRPPANRNPTFQERQNCWQFLEEEIARVRPAVIVAMGRIAIIGLTHALAPKHMKKNLRMKVDHGTVIDLDVFKLVWTYHPAAQLYNPVIADAIKEDFRKVKKIVEEI